MTKKIIFNIAFNYAKFWKRWMDKSKTHYSLTEEWIQERFELWKNITYPSLLNQNIQDWEVYLKCDIKSKDVVEPLFNSLNDSRIKFAYLGTEQSQNLIQSFESSDLYYIVRIDSDDAYHPNVLDEIIQYEQPNKFLLYQKGYILDLNSKSLYQWNSKSPGFFTWIVKEEKFRNLNDALGQGGGHQSIVRRNPIILNDFKYIHTDNSLAATKKQSQPDCGGQLSEEKRKEVLVSFKLPHLI